MILGQSSLRFLEPHGLLSWCLWLVSCGLLSAGLLQDVRIGVTRWMRNSTRRTTTSSKSTADTPNSGWISSARNGRGHIVLPTLYVLGFVAIAIGGTYGVVTIERRASYPVQKMNRVWVKQRLSPDDFRAEVRDPDTGEWNQFTFNSCKDYPITKEIQHGVVLCLLKYEERPGCMSVAKDNLGYILWRDNDHNPILVANAGQATTSCSTASARPERQAQARP